MFYHTLISSEDKESFMKRYSVKNRQNQKGPEITLDESKNERLLVYHAYFKRLLMDEGGDNTNCVNYPNKQFKTFADCDQDFIRVNPSKAYELVSMVVNKHVLPMTEEFRELSAKLLSETIKL